MMHYLNEMIWFPAVFLAGNISFEPVDDSSVRVTLTGQGRTPPGPCSSARRDDSPASWPSATGPHQQRPGHVVHPGHRLRRVRGLRLPARGKAAFRLPGGDFDYIDVTVTSLHYDTGAAPPEGGSDEDADLRGH